MDGEFSLVRLDGASRRVRRQRIRFQGPVRENESERHSFGYLSVAADRKAIRQRGETRNLFE
jgi:hypothetical protein